MMSLITCRECKAEISSEAKTCPQCGAPQQLKTRPDGCLKFFIIVIGLLVLAWVIGRIGNNSSGNKPEASLPRIGSWATVKPNTTACFTRESWKSIMGYVQDHDQQAFNNMISSGRCFVMRGNTRAKVGDISVFYGCAQIRPEGETMDLYVASGGLSD